MDGVHWQGSAEALSYSYSLSASESILNRHLLRLRLHKRVIGLLQGPLFLQLLDFLKTKKHQILV